MKVTEIEYNAIVFQRYKSSSLRYVIASILGKWYKQVLKLTEGRRQSE